MAEPKKEDFPEIIVPREDAVFWLDSDGFWCNEGGRFELKKIIRRFHNAIEKDDDGYYVTQINGSRREKVYFPYEDTALFAIDIQIQGGLIMRLNTGRRVELVPEEIYTDGESLYTNVDDEWIKFAERSLLKLSPFLNFDTDPWTFRYDGRSFPVRNKPIQN